MRPSFTRLRFIRRINSFTLKRVRDMTRTYSQVHRTDKYSQHSSINCSIWPNGLVFVYELSGCGLESSCSHKESFFYNGITKLTMLRFYYCSKVYLMLQELFVFFPWISVFVLQSTFFVNNI